MRGLGATANAGIGYMADGTIDPANAAIAGWVNVFSMGNGLLGTVGWNAAGGALGNWLTIKILYLGLFQMIQVRHLGMDWVRVYRGLLIQLLTDGKAVRIQNITLL
ncbi:hypothetical protein [Cronobacter dublinensis]|uniref:hypothetical protein n=1 Tax=Cronobacter dublinensis TaxID=413497 RepID=UPI003F68CB5C